VNCKKFFICLIIILFAIPAASEIYKYVDETGNVHFTDDVSNVPVEQRATLTVSEEYKKDPNTEQAAESAAKNEDWAEESVEEINDLSDETESRDEVYDSDGTADDAQTADLDAIRSQLDMMKKEIDREYHALIKQKKQLAKESKALKDREEILKHNKNVELLNKKAEVYAKKGKIYEARVDAYNEQIGLENAKAKKKAGTP